MDRDVSMDSTDMSKVSTKYVTTFNAWKVHNATVDMLKWRGLICYFLGNFNDDLLIGYRVNSLRSTVY